MVAPGPMSFMASRPPTLTATPNGARAFAVKFPAALGPLLAKVLKIALGNLDRDIDYRPKEANTVRLHDMINDYLVRCLEGHDELLIRMTQETQGDGPAGFKWLLDDIDPKSSISAISTLMSVLTTPIDGDVIASMNAKISDNASLPEHLSLKASILTVLLLVKLPDEFATLKAVVVEKDTLPTVKELVTSVTKSTQLAKISGTPMNSHASFAFVRNNHSKVCFNCDDKSGNHFHSTCPKPKQACFVCGTDAGHLNKHCLAQSDREIPASLPESTKEKILKNRIAWKQGTFKKDEHANFMADENFWEELNNMSMNQ